MAKTSFNFIGFLIAHRRGKDLEKKDRNKNALLSAVTGDVSHLSAISALSAKKKAKLVKEIEPVLSAYFDMAIALDCELRCENDKVLLREFRKGLAKARKKLKSKKK